MITVQTIIGYVESLSGHPLNRDEGVHHGSAERPLTGALLCWMATTHALAQAGAAGVELVIAHESLYYPYGALPGQAEPAGWEEWPTNRRRRELLQRHNLTLLRVHGSLDEICIFNDFAALLGLGQPVEAEPGLVKVYEIAPRPLAELVAQVKERVGMPAVRVSCPQGLGQIVHRVGLPWGGLGLFVNVGYQQKLIAKGCDVFIAGEADDYGFRFSAECGIPMIETGHDVSENPGLEHFAQMLRARFPDLNVLFYACPPSWQVV